MGYSQSVGEIVLKILALDTTTFLGSLALLDDDMLIAAAQMGTSVTYSERLIAQIDHLLQGASWTIDDVDLIAVALGPGSFTGLRIGIGTAKGLALATSTPLVGASSLEVMAYGGHLYAGPVVAVIDARRDEVYASAYRFTDGTIAKRLLDESVMSPEALADMLGQLDGRPLLVGDGARRYADLFRRRRGNDIVIAHDVLHFPHAAYLARLGSQRYESGGSDDLSTLRPNYIRLSDAEIGFQGRGTR